MARPHPVQHTDAHATDPTPADWQALRGELVALLDQVGGRYRDEEPDPAYDGFAQRMRDLREQVVDVPPDDRRREALRSVKRQVERFHDREDHDYSPLPEAAPLPGRENVLSAAIAQIRERTQMAAPAPLPPAAANGPPDGARAAQLMDTLSARLEQLEAELRAQAGNAVHVKEIADQVAQLSHVVELLAGAIGETGQVKRLEGQIAELAHMVAQAPRVDMGVVTDRLDDLTATVERLADLQVQQVQHAVLEAEAGTEDDAATQSLRAIEGSIRAIYDRIDAIEQAGPSPVPQLERLTDILTELTTRIGAETARPERLLGLVDALNARITDIEGKGEHVTALKADIADLRTAVLTAIEPRFAAIETQLDALGDKLAAPAETPPALAQIEGQMRLLLARIDQTGEQIQGLAERQGEAPAAPLPDFEALAGAAATRAVEAMQAARVDTPAAAVPDFEAIAEMVASRASEAITRAIPPTPDLNALAAVAAARASVAVADRVPPAPDMAAFAALVAERTGAIVAENQAPAPDFEALAALAATRAVEATAGNAATTPRLADDQLTEIELRMSRLVQDFLAARPIEDFSAIQQGIRRVDERLARLEIALAPRVPDAIQMAAPAAPAASVAPPAAAVEAAPAPAEPAPTAIEPQPAPAGGADDPARDRMPRNPGVEAPLREFGFPDLAPVATALEARVGRSAALGFETPTISEPLPRDDDATDDSLLFNAAPEAPRATYPAPAEPVTPSSRNTFIEAARRAAQRQNATKPANDPNSLIGRALARFQAGAGDKDASADTGNVPQPPQDEPVAKVKPVKAKRLGRRLAGDAMTPDDGGFPVEAPPDAIDMPPADRRAPHRDSFLLRYRRPILIAASLVAISFMTLNLVMQRLRAGSDATAPTADVAVAPALPAVATGTAPTETAATPAPATPAATPADASASAAAKPMSAIAPAAPDTPAVASAAPADNSAQTATPPAGADPTTTGAIGSAPVLDYAATDTAMPPALQAANAAAGSTAGPVTLASADADAATPAPAVADSPVKVALPPDTLGPLDLRQAAADGDARAQFEIGAVYQEGRALPADFGQAEVWYERAAAQGFAPAQYRLGNLYELGKGVAKDMEQARLWYQRAAEAGNRMAMHNLASLYAGGAFGKQDFATAAEWFERAANLGLKDSQFNLGMLYSRGLGVPQDMGQSYKWFALAAATGDADAAKARDNIAKSLDADMLQTANADVAAFKPQPIDLAANFAPLGTWTKNFDPGQAITDKTVVSKVQLALTRLGFDVGTPNGHMGPKTADAIKAFERGTGMTEVGAINPRLLAVLGSQPV